jgi:hypothetical protein
MPVGAGAVSGAASGASAGMAFGPWGAAAGAVIGFVGGLFGDAASAKARKAARRANAYEMQGNSLRAFAQNRLAFRQQQVVQSQYLAAAVVSGADINSSGYQGNRASLGTQSRQNFEVSRSLWDSGVNANTQRQLAGKYATQASNINSMVDAGAQVVSQFGRFYNPNPPPATSSSGPVEGVNYDFGLNNQSNWGR